MPKDTLAATYCTENTTNSQYPQSLNYGGKDKKNGEKVNDIDTNLSYNK